MTEEEIGTMLARALGESAGSLTKGELAVAKRVLEWAFGDGGASSFGDAEETRIRAVCGAITEVFPAYYGITWERFTSRCRKRELVNARYIAFHMLATMTDVPKNGVAARLGIDMDHATVLYGIARCEDWLKVDRTFRNDYFMLRGLVNARMEGVDVQKVCQKLNN